MEAEKIASALNARKAGTDWRARHPAHDVGAACIVRPFLARRQHGTQP